MECDQCSLGERCPWSSRGFVVDQTCSLDTETSGNQKRCHLYQPIRLCHGLKNTSSGQGSGQQLSPDWFSGCLVKNGKTQQLFSPWRARAPWWFLIGTGRSPSIEEYRTEKICHVYQPTRFWHGLTNTTNAQASGQKLSLAEWMEYRGNLERD